MKASLKAKAAKMILEILNEERTTSFYFSSLSSKVLEKMELPIKYRNDIRNILHVMIANGVVEGQISGETVQKIWYKEKTKKTTDGIDPQVPALQEKIVFLEKKLTETESKKVEIITKEVEKYIGIEIKKLDGKTTKVQGIFHKQFAKLMQLAQARMNIMIFGPTGCGKSHVCQQVAEALGLRFCFVSCTSGMSEGVLSGKLLPIGTTGKFEYVMSEFVDCFENGGVFLLDELDAADPNVLLLINAALANGSISLTNRPKKPYAKRHKDFICIAAANTAGTNADRLYSGRNKLDGATLDRFQVGKVVFDYDPEVEKQLCPDEALLKRCLKIRKAIEDNRLERAMSTRFIKDAYRMTQDFGWTTTELDDAFFAGWREDERNKVKYVL